MKIKKNFFNSKYLHLYIFLFFNSLYRVMNYLYKDPYISYTYGSLYKNMQLLD